MEGSSKPDIRTLGLGRSSATPGYQLSGSLEKLHSQADSYLTAARLVRRGWGEERKKTGWQFSHFNYSTRQPSLSSSDGNQGPNRAEICLKDPRNRRVPDMNRRKTAEDSVTGSEKNTDEAKQTSEGANRLSANRQANRKMDLCSQAGVVYIWASGCRSTCRQSRRFKAPILPVIAEM